MTFQCSVFWRSAQLTVGRLTLREEQASQDHCTQIELHEMGSLPVDVPCSGRYPWNLALQFHLAYWKHTTFESCKRYHIWNAIHKMCYTLTKTSTDLQNCAAAGSSYPRIRSWSQSGTMHSPLIRSLIVSRTALKLFSFGFRLMRILKVSYTS